MFRSSHPEVLLGKLFLKMCSKFTGEHPCRRVISIKLQCTFFEITLRYGCSPIYLPLIFRRLFTKNICTWLLLNVTSSNGFLISPPYLISLTSFQSLKYQPDFKHFFTPSKLIFFLLFIKVRN